MVPDLRDRLRSDDFLLGTWLTILDPAVPELLAGSGFDLLVADGEHGPVATSDLVAMLIATRAAGVPVLYRVAANEPVRIMHALDSGASGVVVPQVRTVADAERAVAWCRYPPAGLRGIAPRRASGYGRATAAYLAGADDLVTCCIQVETREALDDLDAILAVPGRRHGPRRPERPVRGDRPHRRPRPPRRRGGDRARSSSEPRLRGSRPGSGPAPPPRPAQRREPGLPLGDRRRRLRLPAGRRRRRRPRGPRGLTRPVRRPATGSSSTSRARPGWPHRSRAPGPWAAGRPVRRGRRGRGRPCAGSPGRPASCPRRTAPASRAARTRRRGPRSR